MSDDYKPTLKDKILFTLLLAAAMFAAVTFAKDLILRLLQICK